MNVRQRIKTVSLELAGERRVMDVRIGLGYTAVLLDDGRLGVAYTFHRDQVGGCTVFKAIRPLAGRKAFELLHLFDSKDMVESAVALATSNALSNRMKDGLDQGDVLDKLEIVSDDRVGMVGYFAPVIPPLRKKTSHIRIFEQDSGPKNDVFSEEEAYRQLPNCQIALLTSTSIINNTVDRLLEAAANCREVVMLGASTPLLPAVFKGTSVNVLSGVVVTDPENIMRVVSEGGGMRYFKGHINKVNMRL